VLLLVLVQVYKIAPNMVQISLSLNVVFAVQLLNGFVGAQHIFVSLATKNKSMVTMSQGRKRMSYLNVKQQIIVH
jgi:hypothetical protein